MIRVPSRADLPLSRFAGAGTTQVPNTSNHSLYTLATLTIIIDELDGANRIVSSSQLAELLPGRAALSSIIEQSRHCFLEDGSITHGRGFIDDRGLMQKLGAFDPTAAP